MIRVYRRTKWLQEGINSRETWWGECQANLANLQTFLCRQDLRPLAGCSFRWWVAKPLGLGPDRRHKRTATMPVAITRQVLKQVPQDRDFSRHRINTWIHLAKSSWGLTSAPHLQCGAFWQTTHELPVLMSHASTRAVSCFEHWPKANANPMCTALQAGGDSPSNTTRVGAVHLLYKNCTRMYEIANLRHHMFRFFLAGQHLPASNFRDVGPCQQLRIQSPL